MCLLPDPFLSTFLLCFYYKGAEPCIQSVVRAGARQEDRGEESQDISLQLSAWWQLHQQQLCLLHGSSPQWTRFRLLLGDFSFWSHNISLSLDLCCIRVLVASCCA